MALGPIVVRNMLPETRAQVWQMLTSDESRTNWWPGTQIVAEMGGRIVESETTESVSEDGTDLNETLHEGVVDVHVPEQTLGFRWKNLIADNDTNVVILLRPDDENLEHTVITVIESGFAGHPDAAELVEVANKRWTGLLNTLAAFVSGEEITSEESTAEETVDENDAKEHDAEETTAENNLGEEHNVVEATGEENTGSEATVTETTATEDAATEDAATEGKATEGTVVEDTVAENIPEDSAFSVTAENTEELSSEALGTETLGTEATDVAVTDAEDMYSADVDDEDAAAAGALAEESGTDDLGVEETDVVEAEADETYESENDSDATSNAESTSEDINNEVGREELTPLILPDIPEEFLQPEPEDDLGENAFTGEVPITISDTGGVAVDDIITEEDIEEGSLTEWEKLLHGESLDND